jgi:hypothetical protein
MAGNIVASEAASALGKRGNAKRWGPPRRHNVADLDPIRRERIEAFIEAERRAQEREKAKAS